MGSRNQGEEERHDPPTYDFCIKDPYQVWHTDVIVYSKENQKPPFFLSQGFFVLQYVRDHLFIFGKEVYVGSDFREEQKPISAQILLDSSYSS